MGSLFLLDFNLSKFLINKEKEVISDMIEFVLLGNIIGPFLLKIYHLSTF